MLTGFLDEKGQARGRPVGVAIDRSGALLVADDVGNAVWRVTGVAQAARVTTPEEAPTTTVDSGRVMSGLVPPASLESRD